MVFISIPYSHKDKNIIAERVKILSKYSADLLKNNKSCISPITMGVTILQHAELPSDFTFWKKLSYDLLAISTELHVLMVDGWRESEGVTAEIAFAIERGFKITYIDESSGYW